MRNSLLALILLITFLSFCSKKNSTDSEVVSVSDLLTKDGEISGWPRDGNSWTANSSADLNNYINGEEPVYTRNGFVEGAMQSYSGSIFDDPVSVQVRIFNQGNENNAQTLFNELVLMLINPVTWDDGAGEEAKIERLQLTQKIIFWKRKYFVSMTITSNLDEALNILKTFANNIHLKIK